LSTPSPAGGLSLAGTAGTRLDATVATITDPNLSATASACSATINWGDASGSAGTVAGGSGNFTVTGNHAYAVPGTYPVAVTITSLGNSQGSSTVTDSATITAAPATALTGAPSVSATGAGFSGSANPNGLPTTAFFQHGLDPKYSGGGPVVYTQSTPAQAISADFSSHVVSASVSGLVPIALYDVRLVAQNADGATVGPDVTFMTAKGPTPSAPTLGKIVNISPVSGIVLVKINGQFVPLTELEQIPNNVVINALRGSLKLITSSGGGLLPARDAAAHGKRPALKTEAGTFGGAIFKISQATKGANKGLATLTLVEGAFHGAPTDATCTTKKSGRSPTAATAPSPASRPTASPSPTPSATRRSPSAPTTAT